MSTAPRAARYATGRRPVYCGTRAVRRPTGPGWPPGRAAEYARWLHGGLVQLRGELAEASGDLVSVLGELPVPDGPGQDAQAARGLGSLWVAFGCPVPEAPGRSWADAFGPATQAPQKREASRAAARSRRRCVRLPRCATRRPRA